MSSDEELPEHSSHPHWYKDQGIWYLRGAARHFKGETVTVESRKGRQMVSLSNLQEVRRYKAQEPMRPRQIQPYIFSAIMLTSKRKQGE